MDTLVALLIVGGCCIFLGLRTFRSFQGKGNGCGCGCAGGCSSNTSPCNTQSYIQKDIQQALQHEKPQEGDK